MAQPKGVAVKRGKIPQIRAELNALVLDLSDQIFADRNEARHRVLRRAQMKIEEAVVILSGLRSNRRRSRRTSRR